MAGFGVTLYGRICGDHRGPGENVGPIPMAGATFLGLVFPQIPLQFRK